MSPHDYQHHMGRRSFHKDYSHPGLYHITIHVSDGLYQPFGRVEGDVSAPDGSPEAPHVALSDLGAMVEQELGSSITAHYPMVEVQEHVVMPEHLHFILAVRSTIVSQSGRVQHLGQVIAGFKKGCNRKFWEWQERLSGQSLQAPSTDTPDDRRGKPASTESSSLRPAVSPQASSSLYPAASPHASAPDCYKVPSKASTGRQVLFASGYVDVMPIREGQLETQRRYIRHNPRSRLMRMQNPACLRVQRQSTPTALSLRALGGYLTRECPPSQFTADTWQLLQSQLLKTDADLVICDSYGNRDLLSRRLLPVVCHRKDKQLRFAEQKARCLQAAAEGAVLVSARIANGEQEIIDAVMAEDHPVVLIEDNGFSDRYHPSEQRMEPCGKGQLLLLTPWIYHYRPADEGITVAVCKAMNCVAQSLCRLEDGWWKK